MLFHSSLFFKFWISCQDARKLNKVKFKFKLFFFSCAQTLIFLTQLTAFTVFEICRKLNSACCNYLHFSLRSLKKFPSLLSNNSHVIQKYHIFDDEIDHRYCVKNLLRFLTNIIARIFKDFCYIRFVRIQIILKLKRNHESYSLLSLFLLFVDISFLFFRLSKSKWFSIQPFFIQINNSYRKLPPASSS